MEVNRVPLEVHFAREKLVADIKPYFGLRGDTAKMLSLDVLGNISMAGEFVRSLSNIQILLTKADETEERPLDTLLGGLVLHYRLNRRHQSVIRRGRRPGQLRLSFDTVIWSGGGGLCRRTLIARKTACITFFEKSVKSYSINCFRSSSHFLLECRARKGEKTLNQSLLGQCYRFRTL